MSLSHDKKNVNNRCKNHWHEKYWFAFDLNTDSAFQVWVVDEMLWNGLEHMPTKCKGKK